MREIQEVRELSLLLCGVERRDPGEDHGHVRRGRVERAERVSRSGGRGDVPAVATEQVSGRHRGVLDVLRITDAVVVTVDPR